MIYNDFKISIDRRVENPMRPILTFSDQYVAYIPEPTPGGKSKSNAPAAGGLPGCGATRAIFPVRTPA